MIFISDTAVYLNNCTRDVFNYNIKGLVLNTIALHEVPVVGDERSHLKSEAY